MPLIDRVGTFRVMPIQWTIEESDKSSSVAVAIRFEIRAEQVGEVPDNPEEGIAGGFAEWPHGYDVYGRFWVVKADGSINQKSVETLRDVLGWDGDFATVLNSAAPAIECQVEVEESDFEGKRSFRVKWLNPLGSSGGLKKADPDKVKALSAKYGSLIRAAAGKGPAAPAGKPGSPPPPARTAPARRSPPARREPSPASAAGQEPGYIMPDDTPF